MWHEMCFSQTALYCHFLRSPQDSAVQTREVVDFSCRFSEGILAKCKGEVNQAKEYLWLAKGFDPLIEA
jgi:hypothetical protein